MQNKKRKTAIFTLSFGLIVLCSFTLSNKFDKKSSSKDQRIEQRVDSVLKLMTLEEKIGQMIQYNGGFDVTGPTKGDVDVAGEIRKGMCGSLLNVVGTEAVRKAQKVAVEESRLKIPLIIGLDVIHGFKTIFPVPLGEAASWDMSLIELGARTAAVEASAAGINWTFAPMVDICRDARWGRIMEGAGEDPYYGSQVAIARVHGFQGNDLAANNTIVACAKHFAAYGGAEAGRDYNIVDVSERTMNEIYLPPFKAAVDAGVQTFMNSFNEIGGVPSTSNQDLTVKTLKKQWGFDGFIVSDWGSVQEMINHGVAANDYEAARWAMKGVCDMEMVTQCYLKSYKELLKNNEVSMKDIDDAVRRVLRVKFRLGLFDDPYRYCDAKREKSEILTKETRESARKVAQGSIVLLKNEKQLLPLKKDVKTIAVIGPLADSQKDMIGEWSAFGEGKDAVSFLQGIKSKVSSSTKVIYEKGCDLEAPQEDFSKAVEAASKADVVVVCLGESRDMSGEAHSRGQIDLPGSQEQMLKAIVKTGKPVVLLVSNGRPLILTWEDKNVNAILDTWFLGTEAGNAAADVLFGDYNPSGKLPVTFPYHQGQIPIYYNYKTTGRPYDKNSRYNSRYIDIPNAPLYPFGYGLSYTKFDYSGLTLSKTKIGKTESFQVSVTVKNTGSFDGQEVVQLYLRNRFADVTRPVKELRGFQKVAIAKGASKTISFTVKPADLEYYDRTMTKVVKSGAYQVFVGTNSSETLQADFSVE